MMRWKTVKCEKDLELLLMMERETKKKNVFSREKNANYE